MKKSKESNEQNYRKCPSIACTCGHWIETGFLDKIGNDNCFIASCSTCDKYWAVISQTKKEGKKIVKPQKLSLQERCKSQLITCTCGFQMRTEFLRKVGDNECFMASCPHCRKYWVVINDTNAGERIRSAIFKSLEGGEKNGNSNQ